MQTKNNSLRTKPSEKVSSFFNNHQVKTVIGVFTLLFGVFLGISLSLFSLVGKRIKVFYSNFKTKKWSLKTS
jgi:hypothetical protein